MTDPFTREVVRQALVYAGKDESLSFGIEVPRNADPYTHATSQHRPLPTSADPLFLEAMRIAEGVKERNLRKQLLCAVYRRMLRVSDRVLAHHFPGTRGQRDQWVRRGVLRLAQKASPELLNKLNEYGRSRDEVG